jgi:hypothetical protein
MAHITIPATFIGLGLLTAYVALSINLGEGFAIPVGILGIIGGAVVMIGPVGKALAARITRHSEQGLDPGEVDEIHARLQELEQSQARLAELEERVDFTERLLAQRKDPGRLP